MRRTILGAVVSVALMAPAAPAFELQDEPESCLAVNPAQPKCSFEITSESTSQTVTGAVGAGTWKVIVKRGKKKMVIQPAGPEPEPVAFAYEVGDKVTAITTGPGTWVLAGHD
ncbi:MAG: hypothetical protein ACRDI3_08935 [Actinomycetota bacterium]